MDALDRRIIEILKKDGRMPFTKIGNIVGMPNTTVYFRIQRMKKRGDIRGFTVVTSLDVEMPSTTFGEFVEVVQKMIEGQREEGNLLWEAVRICGHRLEAVEGRVRSG